MIIICFFRIFFRTFDIFQLKGFGPNFEKCRTPLVCILIWTLVLQNIIKFNRIYFYQKSLFSKLKWIFQKVKLIFSKTETLYLSAPYTGKVRMRPLLALHHLLIRFNLNLEC